VVRRDPSIAPDACSYAASLATVAQGALAPFQPLLSVIDLLCQAVQFVLALKDAVTDPTANPKLLGMVPGLVEKLNKVLSLVPALPQGVVAYVQLVVDIIDLAVEAIDCALSALRSASALQAQAQAIRERIADVDDAAFRAGLDDTARCCEAEAARTTRDGLDSLGAIARLLCVIRALLMLLPGGSALQERLAVPDPANLVDVDRAAEALTVLRDALRAVVDVVAALAGGLGVTTAAEPFHCPLDASAGTPATPPAPPPVPALSAVLWVSSGLPVTVVPQAPGGTGPDLSPVRLVGSGFDRSTTWFAGTTQVPATPDGTGRVLIALPARVRARTGLLELRAVNSAAGQAPFAGLDDGDGGARVSNALALEVVP
jgi:hypothetical protein